MIWRGIFTFQSILGERKKEGKKERKKEERRKKMDEKEERMDESKKLEIKKNFLNYGKRAYRLIERGLRKKGGRKQQAKKL